MKLFDKRNIVLFMAIFLLLMMVSSVSAADVSDDAVVGNDAAIDTITSTDTSGSIDDVISAEVSDNPKEDPSDSNESLSGDIVADASSNNDNINKNSVDDSSQDVLKASSDDEVLRATVTFTVGPNGQYRNLAAALDDLGYWDGHQNDDVIIEIAAGTYTGNNNWAQSIDGYFRSLTIRAANNAKVIFDGNYAHRLFTIEHNNVKIEGITFINGNTTGNNGGVAISVASGVQNVTIDKCNFTGNGKNNTYGGAIRINADGTGRYDAKAHDVTISNCYFERNLASVGAGIRSEPGTYDISVINCTGVNNTATTHGGFACLFGDDTTIDNCTFKDNSAPSSGAVHCHSGNVTVKNCTFVNNSAIGGGNNATNGYAGALGLVYTGSPGVTVLDSHFYNNTAKNDGGAIQVMGTGRDAKIINSDFENNTAAYGGAISINGSDTRVTGSTFKNNDATTTTTAVGGGAIFAQGSGTNITDSTFANNTAAEEGGAVFVKGNNIRITDSTLADNIAGDDGGAVYWEGNNGIVDKVICTNNTGISSEGSNSQGGAMIVTGNNLKISNSTFTSDTVVNSPTSRGGALFITGTNTVITDSNFTDCNASQYGGAVQVIGNYTSITNCNFEKNNALPDEDKKDDGLGGAVYIQGTDCHVTDSSFTNNTARNGSAIYVNPNGTGTNYIDNCDFLENQAWVYWLPIVYDKENQKIETNLTGGNNIMNAIYNNGDRNQLKINGSVPDDGWENYREGYPYQDDLEKDQFINITVYDRQGNEVWHGNATTNLSGSISVDIPADRDNWFIINMTHSEDPYYKHITNITAINLNPSLDVTNVTMYQWNASAQEINVTLKDDDRALKGDPINVTVMYTTPADLSGKTSDDGILHISEDTYFKTYEPGVYDIIAVYTYVYWDEATKEIVNKTVTATGKLTVLEYKWNITKEIIAVNGQTYTEGMEIHVNDNVTFNITVSNLVDADIENLKITDLNTTNLTYVEQVDSAWSYDGNNVWSLDNLPANKNSSLIVTFLVTNNGTSINVANASIFEGKQNKSANVTLDATHLVILEITKTADPTEVYVGDSVVFTITVTNNGQSVAHNANITDVLNDAFHFEGSNATCSQDGQTVTWNVGNITPQGSVSVTVNVTVTEPGIFNNTAAVVCDENETKVNDTEEIKSKFVSLAITKDVNVKTVVIGEEVEFTITVTNNGNATATNVTILDEIPQGFEAQGFDGQFSPFTLEPGASKSVKLVVTAVKAGEWTNTANVTCIENDTVINASADVVTVLRLSLNITVGNYTTTPGTLVPVDITVVDERGAKVTIDLDVVVTGPVDNSTLPEHNGKLVFTISTDLGAEGEIVHITGGEGTFEYTVPEDATNGTSYIVTASSGETDQYEAAKGVGYIDVIQYATTTTISSASGAPGEEVTLDVEVTTEDGSPFNGDVVVTCPDGTEVTVHVTDGKGSFDWTIPEDAKDGDEYQFTATFNGNSTYLASNGTGTVTVEEEPQPVPPEPPVPPVPEEPEEPEPEVVPAKMLNTGNPLVALLAAFVLIGLGLKRREEE